MDNTLNRRLVMLREVCAGKRGQRRFAQMVGIKQQSISNYERGSIPSANVLTKIVLVTGVSADWLLTGRGPMFTDGARNAHNAARDEKARDAAEARWVDDSGQPVTAVHLAELLDISEARARAFAESLAQSEVGRNRLPVALRRPDGRIHMLHPAPASVAGLESGVSVDVGTDEIRVCVPGPLLRGRAVRIVPSQPE